MVRTTAFLLTRILSSMKLKKVNVFISKFQVFETLTHIRSHHCMLLSLFIYTDNDDDDDGWCVVESQHE